MRFGNKDIQVWAWVFVNGHARTKHTLGTHAAGPQEVLIPGKATFSLDVSGYPETVRSAHVTAEPDPLWDPQNLIQTFSVPQVVVVPERHLHTGKEVAWEAFVRQEVSDDGTLRLWTRKWGYHPDEDPRVGESVRSPRGALLHAPRGPTGRRSCHGRRIPRLREIVALGHMRFSSF